MRGREGAGQQVADGAARPLALEVGEHHRHLRPGELGELLPPQGVTGVGLSATTSTSSISRRPAATMAAIAPASAQVPCG